MPTVKTKRQMSDEAETLAQSFKMVFYKNKLYLPADAGTGSWATAPEPGQTVWLPLTKELLTRVARQQFGTVFSTPTDLDAFEYMVEQAAEPYEGEVRTVLVRTENGVLELREDGLLYAPTGGFVPNLIPVLLNEDPDAKAEVMQILTNWLNSEEEAKALLRNLATTLAPGWSAVRYVLLLGDGRNGKSVLMQMMHDLFGRDNVSNVSRQNISEGSPVVTELNGSLLNIIFDGVAVYLKDSGHEKSLIAGEEIGVRLLYRSSLTRVQTNALFLEGLNREPKSSDKSSALQERLIRFWFKNTYEDDLVFKDRMLSEQMLGALLSLLIDNYVKREDKAVMLAPTSESKALKLEHMTSNSLALQFIEHLIETGDPMDLIGESLTELTEQFRKWRLKDGDMSAWTKDGVRTQFKPVVNFTRKSVRSAGTVKKSVVVEGFKKTALELIASHQEKEDSDALVPE